MAKSPKKPKKPRPTFPLFYHASGQWAKKIKGKLYYFGTDSAAAEKRYDAEKEDIANGRSRQQKPEAVTLRELVNRFLSTKRQLVDSGELSRRTWADYYATCDRLIEAFGKGCDVMKLTTADFERLRAKLADTRGPVAIGNEVQRVRSLFRFAFDNDMIDRPVKFGTVFKKPSKKTMRKARHEAGDRMIEPEVLLRIIEAADVQLRAMTLLALNAGFGQTDAASLPVNALDLDRGWVNFPRPKTAVARRCKLWPETVAALREVLAERREPQVPADADLVFLTRQHGRRWVRTKDRGDGKPATSIDAVTLQFSRLLESLDLPRFGFYTLRHIHRTIADRSKDQPACDLIMGHDNGSMASQYRERIEDERLEVVANVVRDWLFGK